MVSTLELVEWCRELKQPKVCSDEKTSVLLPLNITHRRQFHNYLHR